VKDRLITLLGALLALAIVYALFFQRPGETPATKPLSIEAGRNGYLGLWNWLARQGVPVRSLRERYTVLPGDDSLRAGGNILVVTMPFRTPLRNSEIPPLQNWVLRGNTLLILAALDDTPDWLPVTGAEFIGNLAALTGMQFRMAPGTETGDGVDAEDAADDAKVDPAEELTPFDLTRPPIAAQTAIELRPVAAHPLLEGVESLRGFSDGQSALWRGRYPDEYRLVLRLAFETSSGLDALWQLPRGRGQIILAASGSLLANRNIGEGDARHFVANLLRHHLGPDGAVIFDDMHHGLSTLYDAQAFLRDQRLKYTVWFVLAAWLIYILGSSNRLAPPRPTRSAPHQGEFLAAAGGFMARRLDKRAAGLLLIEEWLDEVRLRRGLQRGAEIWPELERTPTLARGVYGELHGYHRRLAGGASVDLVRLHNVLKQAREAVG
jgi:hypothetical protein